MRAIPLFYFCDVGIGMCKLAIIGGNYESFIKKYAQN